MLKGKIYANKFFTIIMLEVLVLSNLNLSTTSESIMVNVFALFSLEQLKVQLSQTKCIALMIDASNRENIKLLPVVQFYDPYEGIQIKLLDIQSQEKRQILL